MTLDCDRLSGTVETTRWTASAPAPMPVGVATPVEPGRPAAPSPPLEAAAPAGPPPLGWYPDPTGRHQLRRFEGEWTQWAADAGVTVTDPIGRARQKE